MIKDSYAPILEEIKRNEEVTQDSSKLFSFSFFEELRDGYLFQALEGKEKKKINSILEKSVEVNDFKNKSNDKAENSMRKALNDAWQDRKLGDITIGKIHSSSIDHERIYKDIKWFDLLISGELKPSLMSAQIVLTCEFGNYFTTKINNNIDETEIGDHKVEYISPLDEVMKRIYKDHPSESMHQLIDRFFIENGEFMIRDLMKELNYILYEEKYET